MMDIKSIVRDQYELELQRLRDALERTKSAFEQILENSECICSSVEGGMELMAGHHYSDCTQEIASVALAQIDKILGEEKRG